MWYRIKIFFRLKKSKLISTMKLAVLFFLFLSLTIKPVYAGLAVTLHGTLIESAPCVINDGETVVVDFGDEVMTTRVDGHQYRKKIDFTLTCNAKVSSKQKLKITGNTVSSGFEGNVLDSEKPGLGIALYNDEDPYSPGEWLDFDSSSLPDIYAVPVKQADITLAGGTFRVLASMVVEYQ